MFVKFKQQRLTLTDNISVRSAEKINKYFGSLEQAYKQYNIKYQKHESDLFLLFRSISADRNLQKKIGDKKFISLVNVMRQEFLDEGEFGEKWLTGQHIFNTMKTLQKKNNKFSFLGLISFDCELMYNSVTAKFEKQFAKGKRQFGLIQNHFFVKQSDQGTHWVGIFVDLDNKFIYYFDSNGEKQSDKFRASCKTNNTANTLFSDYYNFFVQKMQDTSVPLKSLSAKLQPKTIEDLIYDNSKSKIAKGRYKQVSLYFNKKQHQYKDGNCGTYAIFFIYMLSNYLKKMGIAEINQLLRQNNIKDSIIEKFKSKIFLELPQIITMQNIAQIRKILH